MATLDQHHSLEAINPHAKSNVPSPKKEEKKNPLERWGKIKKMKDEKLLTMPLVPNSGPIPPCTINNGTKQTEEAERM